MIEPRDTEQRTVPPDGKLPEEQPAWRSDFPVDWPQDQYVGRRDFTKFMVLTSFAFFLGQLWIGISNWFRRRRPALEPRKVATLEQVKELEPGQALTFHYPTEDDPCLLVRLPDQGGACRYAAYDQRCTHLSCGVIPDPHAPDQLLCPCHHGHFDCATGRPVAGPPRRPLPVIELAPPTPEGDIWATGVKERTV